MPILKKKARRSADEIIRERTSDLRSAHKQALNEIAFTPRYQAAVNTKEARRALPFQKWLTANIPPDQRLQLPWSLDYFRLQVSNAVDDGKRCPYNDELLTVQNFSLDHIVPVSRREEFRNPLIELRVQLAPIPGMLFSREALAKSQDELLRKPSGIQEVEVETRDQETILLLCAYAWENLALCCIDCNKRKGEMTVADWNTLRSALGLMTDVSKRYVWKKLLLSEHTMQAFIMRQKAIAARSGAQKAAVQDDDPNW